MTHTQTRYEVMPAVKAIPSDAATEQAVLGSLLIDPATLAQITSLLHPRDFYVERNRWIYEAMRAIVGRGEPIDFITVCQELERADKLNPIGGSAYLTSLVNATPTAVNIETYARKVADLAGKRRIIGAAGEIAGYAYDGLDYPTAYAQAQASLLAIAPDAAGKCVDSDEAMGEAILRFRLRQDDPTDYIGITTGLIDFDEKMRGFQVGLHLLQGQTSHGKTAFALAVAEGVAKKNNRTLFVTMEMSEKQITDRRIAYTCGISTDEILTGKINENGKRRAFNRLEVERVEKAAQELSTRPLEIAAMFGATSAEITALITERKARRGLDFVVVDYVQLCRDEAENDVKRLGLASKNLKDAADRLQIPILLLSQVNRSVNARENKIAGVGDSRGSGETDENADSVITVYNPDAANRKSIGYKKTNTIAVYIDKDRLGGAAGKACELTLVDRTGAIVNKVLGG